MADYLLGIDLGTSSVRAGIFDRDGIRKALASRAYPIDTPQPGRAEQSPELWWTAVCESIAESLASACIAGEQIAGVSFSGQMHGTVLLGRDGVPLIPAIIWADSRSSRECGEIEEILGHNRLEKILLNRPFAGTQAATLRWMQANDPDTWRATRRILLPKDYLRWRMCGLFNSEPSDVSGTLLCDIGLRDWSKEILDALSIPVEWLPYIVNSDQYVGETRGLGEICGLPDGIPVVMGGADQPCTALGNGIIGEGTLMVTLGTGGQLLSTARQPVASPELSLTTFCHLPVNRWYVMGATLAAGLALRWFRDTFAAGAPFETLVAEAAAVAPGADGILFHPYLAGRRSPVRDTESAGTFSGIRISHAKGHFVRAILEGVAFELRDNLEVMRTMGLNHSRVLCSGGGAAGDLWPSIIADVFGLLVTVPRYEERACLGAALTAGIGVGIYRDWREAADIPDVSGTVIEPDDIRADIYDERYAAFTSSRPAGDTHP